MAIQYIKFNTPSGTVLGVKEDGVYRVARGDENTQIALGQVPSTTVQAQTNQPISEFNQDTKPSDLEDSDEFKKLSQDEQGAVKAVFDAISENDAESAQRLQAAFRAASQVSDPFFAQQLRMASDAAERGFVSIDQEEAFKEQQLRRSLDDLRTDISNKQEFLSLEESNALRGIERQFEQNLDATQQNLAARGFTFGGEERGLSSRRFEAEKILGEERRDLVESTKRRFGFQQAGLASQLSRGARDVASDTARLQELAQSGRLDLLRSAEEQVGTSGIGDLARLSGTQPLGDITGKIEQQKTADIISGTRNLF